MSSNFQANSSSCRKPLGKASSSCRKGLFEGQEHHLVSSSVRSSLWQQTLHLALERTSETPNASWSKRQQLVTLNVAMAACKSCSQWQQVLGLLESWWSYVELMGPVFGS